MNEPIKLTDRPTPETDASQSILLSIIDDWKKGKIYDIDAAVGIKQEMEHFRRREQQRDAAVKALNGMVQYWERDESEAVKRLHAMGTLKCWYEEARATLVAIKEAK